MSEHASRPKPAKIVRRENLGEGVNRYFYSDGGHTDICVSVNGMLSFFGRRKDELLQGNATDTK